MRWRDWFVQHKPRPCLAWKNALRAQQCDRTGNRMDQIDVPGRAGLEGALDSVSVPLTPLAKHILRH